MYLFESDQSTYKGIFDTKTKNISAIRMCMVLKKMGIKNHLFLLYLSQPELQNVDPYNLPPDDVETRAKISYEVKTNFWYYVREIIRVQHSGGDPVMYEFNRANTALNWLFLNSIRIFLTQPRQTGKTTGIMTIDSWLMFIDAINARIGLVAKDSTLIAENVSRLKEIRNSLPDYMIYNKRDTDNQEGLTYKALGNIYKTYIGPADKKAAKGVARGQSFIKVHFDEFAYTKNIDQVYPAVVSTTDTAGEQARKAGIPANNIITTTAGMLSDPAGAYAYQVKSRCMRFSEKFYDCKNREELVEILKAGSSNQMFYLEYSYKDLGKDETWFERNTLDKNEIQIATDYLNIWQLGTGESIVPINLLKRLQASIMEPLEFSNHGSLMVRWYVEKDILKQDGFKNRNFIIGVDTSDNVGSDFTTLVVTDPTDLTVIATCKCNSANFVNVITCVSDLMNELPSSILIPERNKNGAMLVDILIDSLLKKGINPFYRIYNTFIQDYNSSTPSFSNIDLQQGQNRKHFGFNTTAAGDSRNVLYGKVLINMLNYMADRLHDAELADEIKGLTVRNGRIDHPIGSHDDMCIAWLLTGFFAFFGKNHQMYGIPKGEILKSVSNTGKEVDPFEKERQRRNYERIGELRGLINTTENLVMKTCYERELKHLLQFVDETMLDQQLISADQVKEQMRSERSKFDFSAKNLRHYF